MKLLPGRFCHFSLVILFIAQCALLSFKSAESPVYKVKRVGQQMEIDGEWEKDVWKSVKAISINNFMGKIPSFKPQAKAKMMYDDRFLYVIFRVKDRHVRIQTTNFNGPVSGDACVEFFFAPDSNFPERYFNLEINAGGVPLMGYHINGHKEYTMLQPEELKQLKIAHSLPARLDQEISQPVTWTVECRIPLSVLKKYSNIAVPEKGSIWRANFYKTSSRSSNPHWITWAPVESPKPNFHLPGYFGTLLFR